MGDEADFIINGMIDGRIPCGYSNTSKRRKNNMMQTSRIQHTCPFCGSKYEVIYRTDDGYDYDGHNRGGMGRSYPPEGGCTCATAQALKKVAIKPMCLNCSFFNRSAFSCTNNSRMEEAKRVMKNIQVKVDVTTLKIVNEKDKCDKWRFDTNHIMNYITANSIDYKFPIGNGIVDDTQAIQQKIDPKKLFRKNNGRGR